MSYADEMYNEAARAKYGPHLTGIGGTHERRRPTLAVGEGLLETLEKLQAENAELKEQLRKNETELVSLHEEVTRLRSEGGK